MSSSLPHQFTQFSKCIVISCTKIKIHRRVPSRNLVVLCTQSLQLMSFGQLSRVRLERLVVWFSAQVLCFCWCVFWLSLCRGVSYPCGDCWLCFYLSVIAIWNSDLESETVTRLWLTKLILLCQDRSTTETIESLTQVDRLYEDLPKYAAMAVENREIEFLWTWLRVLRPRWTWRQWRMHRPHEDCRWGSYGLWSWSQDYRERPVRRCS